MPHSIRRRRRARRPVPAGRPAQRERGRPVLARPRPGPRAARRAARHRRRRRARRRAARGGPPLGDRARPAHPAGARRRADRRALLRRQRVGLRRLARHHAGQQRPARARGARPGWCPRSPTRSPPPTQRASPTAGSSPRTCWSTTPARCGSSASASTPRCTGCPPGGPPHDVVDLAGLLYARSPAGGRASRRPPCPAAPHEHGRVLRPRQVRAGVPRPLDALCDELLNPYAVRARRAAARRARPGDRPRRSPTTCARLRRRPHRARPRPRPPPAHPATTETTSSLPGGRRIRAGRTRDDRGARAARARAGARARARSRARAGAGARPATELPTEAGLPIFDDETDDVSWLRARDEPAPPPPPFEEPPERPLFAPDPADGAPARTPRTRPAPAGAARRRVLALRHRPHRQRLPAPRTTADARGGARAATGCGSRLIAAVPAAAGRRRGRLQPRPRARRRSAPTPTTSRPTPSSPTSAPATAAAPLDGLTATDFDPQGDARGEPRAAPRWPSTATPTTAWRTLTYDQSFGPGGLKTGVGLVLDLGASPRRTPRSTSPCSGAPTDVSVYVTDNAAHRVERPRRRSATEAGAGDAPAVDARPARPPAATSRSGYLAPAGRRAASAARSPRSMVRG